MLIISYYGLIYCVLLLTLLRKNFSMSDIRKHIENAPDGKVFFISDFSNMNISEKSVSRALYAAVERGTIIRLANGIYLRPKRTAFGIAYPSVDELIVKIAKHDKAKVMPCGDNALNILGLSTQVPTNYTYLTTGSSRRLTIGNRHITLKRRVPRNFAFKTKLGALLTQALKTLGKNNVGKQELAQIQALIKKEKNIEAVKEDIKLMPIWIRNTVLNTIKHSGQG